MKNMTRFPIESVMNVNSIAKVNFNVKCEITLLLNDKHDEIPYRICRECQFYSQVTHTIKCVITLLLNDKHDEIPYRICCGCQFYSQSENANAKYMI